MSKLRIACIQTNSSPNPEENIAIVSVLIREACAAGAEFITTPEVVGMLEPDRIAALSKAQSEEKHQVLFAFQELALELGIWLLIGSISIKVSDTKLSNRSFLINPNGEVIARYSKIHMFDVEVGDGNKYLESKTYEPGSKAVIAETPWGLMGLTICYDIRFPNLFRDLAKAGAKVIFSPAAFTRVTGEAHWHVLQRARAIENGCYIVSPAQVGTHANNRKTFGHSLIVNPWGEVLADGGTETGFIVSELDLGAVDICRSKVPSLYNDQAYLKPF
ncbi:MAG: amidohydrolase [Rhodospirillaceae bacterium]|nr:amidohydrolase [Rhodospirillaceae bacterium]|tara:strand:- start:1297 stop:2121 length:825 start_codon:yes stop_codon:yes gene_type:complete